jgi:translocation and assembly module TamB
MRRLALLLLALLGAPALLALSLPFALDSDWGRARLAALAERATRGSDVALAIEGLSGDPLSRLAARRIVVSDRDGPWLEIERAEFAWSPGALLHRRLEVSALEAARVALLRLPARGGATRPDGSATEPPLDIDVALLAVARVELAQAIPGGAPVLGLRARGGWMRGARMLELEAQDAERPSDRLSLWMRDGATGIEARVELAQAADGWAARRLGVEGTPALALRGTASGPPGALRVALDAEAGEARARISGTLDAQRMRGEAEATIATTGMAPLPGLAWRDLRVEATLSGTLAAPLLRARLEAHGLRAGPLSSARIEASAEGAAHQTGSVLELRARADAPVLEGDAPGLLSTSPLEAQARVALGEGGARIEAARISHALFAARGAGTVATTGRDAGRIDALVALEMPEIAAPLGALGVTARGALSATARLGGRIDAPEIALEARLAGFEAPGIPGALLGAAPRAEAMLLPADGALGVASLLVEGAILRVEGSGRVARDAIEARVDALVADVAALGTGMSGALRAEARVEGSQGDLVLDVALASDALSRDGFALDAPRARATLRGLPATPSGRIALEARIGEAPVAAMLAGARGGDGAWHLALKKLEFPGLAASGEARGQDLAPLAARIEARARDLAPLGRLLGLSLAGEARLEAEATPGEAGHVDARLALSGRGLAVEGLRAARLDLQASLAGAASAPVLRELRAELGGVALAGEAATLRLQAQGPLDAPRASLSIAAPSMRGSLQASLAAHPVPAATIAAAELVLRGEAFRLREPARLAWRDGLAVERLRIAASTGTIAADGRLGAAASDLRVAATRVPLALLALLDPGLAMDGAVDGELRLSGPLAAPTGRLAMRAEGMRLRDGPAAGLAPARLRIDADIARGGARVDAEATLGSAGGASLRATGSVPLDPRGALALRVAGTAELALLDPLLSPAGQRARGRLALDVALRGSPAEPLAAGRVAITDGSFEDALQGLRVDRVAGEARLEGQMVEAVALRARIGEGEATLSGRAPLVPRAGPFDLSLALRKARLVQSRSATIFGEAALSLAGRLPGQLLLSGRVTIPRAEFRLSEPLPASLPRVEVRETGNGPRRVPRRAPRAAASAAPALPALLGLDVAIEMPDSVFLRGRGVDALAGGALALRGSAAAPEVTGAIALRRGDFTLVGQRLEFTRGVATFDGAAPSDPSLDFEARREANGVTTKVQLGGRPSAPRLQLSSDPEMPPDEVLARLMFGRSVAELSPYELAGIAGGVATMFVDTPGSGAMDKLRGTLGLDQLRLSSTRDGEGVGVEAGRNLAPGVYVGVRPGREPGSYDATVQVEVAPRLRVETDVGAASTGRVGVTWELDY